MCNFLGQKVGSLHEGPVELSLQRMAGVVSESKLIHMSNDSHNGQVQPSALGGISVEVKNMDVLADGILAGKILLREAVVNDCDTLGMFVVPFGDEAPTQQGNSHRLQIVWLDDVLKRVSEVGLTCRLLLPLGPEVDLVVAFHGMSTPVQ